MQYIQGRNVFRGRLDNASRIAFRCFEERQLLAIAAVATAIREGALPKAAGQMCVDCYGVAYCYDHRNYNEPLKVAPVCRKCNSRRGRTKDFPKLRYVQTHEQWMSDAVKRLARPDRMLTF